MAVRRLLVLPFALLLLAAIIVPACGPTGAELCQPTTVKKAGQAPSVQASPNEAGITAVLTGGQAIYAKQQTRIKWLVDSMRAGKQLTIVAGIAEGGGNFQVKVPVSQVNGNDTEFDSTLTFNRAGCWGLALSSGSTDGSLAFRVQPPKSG
jgi:opacity protein-like surface antigen